MKRLINICLLVVLLAACTPLAAPTPMPTPAPTETEAIQATATLKPTATTEPTPTPLPGTVVVPIEEMASGMPWLEADKLNVPVTRFVYFNLTKKPFNDVLVRKAFAAATDREQIVAVAKKYGIRDPLPATTLVNPEVLGRDLYNLVGIPYDPAKAKDYLREAGYGDGSTFPELSFLVTLFPGGKIPAFNEKMADALVAMWQETLGIKMTVVSLSAARYGDLRATNPEGVFLLGWMADYKDPENYFNNLFQSNAEFNYGHFSNSEFDRLVNRAAVVPGPALRQELYIQAEYLLCQDQAALIPLYHSH